jgi:hypothetical protein
MSFVVDGSEETANLDITPLDLFTCTANTKEPLDRLTNNRVGPWYFADITLCVAEEAELLKEAIS